jgi:hypothetical protein
MRLHTITTTVAKSAIALAVLAAGFTSAGTASARGDAFAPNRTEPIGGLTTPAPEPQPSTTCEGNRQCGALRWACDLVGGTYSGWQSSDHGHEHGVCTWPWE